MRSQKSSVIGFLIGFILSCSVHGGAFFLLYKNFTFEKKVVALKEISKDSLKMALTAFASRQQPEYQEETPKQETPKQNEPKKEEPEEPPKPKLPEPVHQQIIKEEPVPVPVPIAEPKVQQEDTKETEETQTTQSVESVTAEPQTQMAASAVQAQNSGNEAMAASSSEDDHIIAIIRAAIDKEAKKNYPSKAKQMRMEGIATIKIKIDKEGNIILLEITKSSGFAMLDTSAIKSIEKASKNFPKPQRDLLFILPVSYQLI
ncbi:MAG: energy transducer TonB [Campylobacteraceae bacterium]|jgi:protein TonB|nr:energy transducer TonB [Campylobacteraceae bacterium]